MTPMHLGQQHCEALSWAGKAPIVILVGLEASLGRRSWILFSSQLSRAREAEDKGKLFHPESGGSVGPVPVELVPSPSLEGFQTPQDKVLSNLVWTGGQTGDLSWSLMV